MQNSEKLCLQWNEFQSNIRSAFGELRKDQDFADVTLACEDGQQISAHKVILVSSSPFFMDILRRNKHPHPLVYMRGIKSNDLLAIVDFLYFGEATVFQEHLDAFLALANELKLEGLEGPTEEDNGRVSLCVEKKANGIRSEITLKQTISQGSRILVIYLWKNIQDSSCIGSTHETISQINIEQLSEIML